MDGILELLLLGVTIMALVELFHIGYPLKALHKEAKEQSQEARKQTELLLDLVEASRREPAKEKALLPD
jgi:hypothetical protein